MKYLITLSFTFYKLLMLTGFWISSNYFKIYNKFLGVVVGSIILSIPTWLITEVNDWTVSNHKYLASVLTCIAIDHLLGTLYHAFKAHDFTFKCNAIGILQKLGLCVLGIILFEIIHNTLSDITFVYEYLKVTTRLIVILYPASSAFKNMSELTNGIFPPIGWIKKIKSFNEDLEFKSFTKPSNFNH